MTVEDSELETDRQRDFDTEGQRDLDTVGEQALKADLRAAGLRVTKPRLAVLKVVREHAHAPTGEIIEATRSQLPDVSHQAVYDILDVLTDSRVIRRIQPLGSLARYEARVGDNHHHLVCRGCGAVVDVDCATGETPCLNASEDHGYAIDEAEVIYWGLCPACRLSASITPPATAPTASAAPAAMAARATSATAHRTSQTPTSQR